MPTPTTRRRLGRALLVAVTVLAVVGGGSACAAGSSSSSGPRGTSGSPTPTVTPSVPTDGVTLQQLGYRFGPVAELSLPRGAVVTAMVDQDNNVTAVLSSPAADVVAGYLRRALPLAGFAVTADNRASTEPALTFVGHGWHGSFTGDSRAAALLVRPGEA